MDIGTCIYRERQKRGLTQPALASSSGIAQANLSNIEKGKREPSLATLRRIAYALGTHASSLLQATEEELRPQAMDRIRLEALAKAVLENGSSLPTAVPEEWVAALRGVFSVRKRLSDRALERDWALVRGIFSPQQIEAIRARIQDERGRRP